jgi:hypothetical protein
MMVPLAAAQTRGLQLPPAQSLEKLPAVRIPPPLAAQSRLLLSARSQQRRVAPPARMQWALLAAQSRLQLPAAQSRLQLPAAQTPLQPRLPAAQSLPLLAGRSLAQLQLAPHAGQSPPLPAAQLQPALAQ